MNTKYTLNVRWTGKQYEASIPESGVVATGVSVQEAIDNAHIAISTTLAEEAKTKQAVRRRPAWLVRPFGQ
jgi:predicted RNase H-like HicB family nuclease